jgi:MarR family transcriptional regulator for hemolysin
MQEMGLISRRAGNADGRTTEVTLTAKGCDYLGKGAPMAVENNAIMEARLSPGEAEELKRLLAKLFEGEAALKNL